MPKTVEHVSLIAQARPLDLRLETGLPEKGKWDARILRQKERQVTADRSPKSKPCN
jgi:hypothetical protein